MNWEVQKVKKLISIVLVITILLLASGLYLCFAGYKTYRDVSYLDAESCNMNVYVPYGVDRDTPQGVILFIHGGSWSGGDKWEEAIRCRLLANRGYITATMNYTLRTEDIADEYNVFTVLDEIDAALQKLKDFLADLGITVDKAALSGYSAGAHLAMLYSYSRHNTSPLDIAFTCSLAGPSDIREEIWGDTARYIGSILTGVEITEEMLDSGEADALLESISPVAYISPDSPPTIVVQGGRDNVVPKANAQSLIDLFTENNVPYDYVYMKRSDHSLIQNPFGHVSYFMLYLKYSRTYFGY